MRSNRNFQSGFVMAHLDHQTQVGGRSLGHGIYELAIWWRYRKVLSVCVFADLQVPGTPACGGSGLFIRCCKRGEWEDRIMEENVQPRTLEQLRTDGLVPKQRWVDWWNHRLPHVRGLAQAA
jgi:hypothetical protein